MSDINDELCRQRNSEIANDNYYRLKWLLDAGRKFIAELQKAIAAEPQHIEATCPTCDQVFVMSKPSLAEIWHLTEELRKELDR